MPIHFHDKLKNEIQNTILILLIFVINTNNGNGNSINRRFLDVLLIFYSECEIFPFVFSFLQKKNKKKDKLTTKCSTCFSFFIFKGKMKIEIQLTPVILFFNNY